MIQPLIVPLHTTLSRRYLEDGAVQIYRLTNIAEKILSLTDDVKMVDMKSSSRTGDISKHFSTHPSAFSVFLLEERSLLLIECFLGKPEPFVITIHSHSLSLIVRVVVTHISPPSICILHQDVNSPLRTLRTLSY